MLTCKQVSKALAEGDYKDLPPRQQFLLRLHIALCFICHGFNRDIMSFQDLVRAFRGKEDDLAVGPPLPEAARQRMRDEIEKQRHAS